MSVSNVHPVGIPIHKIHLIAKVVQRGITPNLRQMIQYAMIFVPFVHEDFLVKQNKQRISWKDVKIVPVVDFLNLKDQMTAIAKGAQKENGVLKLVLPKNPSASIAFPGRMV